MRAHLIILLLSALTLFGQGFGNSVPFRAAAASQATTNVTGQLIDWWKFDEGSGTTTIDSAGGDHVGTITPGTSGAWTNGIIAGAYRWPVSGRMWATNSIQYGIQLPIPDFNTGPTQACTGLAWDSASNCFVVVRFQTNQLFNKLVGVSTNGAKLYEIQLSANITNGVQGVAHDPTDDTFWYVDYLGLKVMHIDRGGALLNEFATAQANGLAYRASDDALLVGDGASTINVYSAATGSSMGSISLSGTTSADGITVDPNDGTLWVTDFSSVVRHLTSSGGAISSFNAVPAEIEHLVIMPIGYLAVTADQFFHGNLLQGNRIHIMTTNGAIVDTAAFTISAWIYPTTLNSTHIVIDNYVSPASTAMFGIFVRSTGAIAASVGPSTLETSAGSIVEDAWQHVVATYNGITSNLVVYKNGVILTSGARSVSTYQADTTNFIGARVSSLPLIGAIDDVRIYKRPLSTGEVAMLYRAGTNGLIFPATP